MEHKKVSIKTLERHKKEGIKTVISTAYNSWQSLFCNLAGIDAVLVGDSLAMTELGYPNTNAVTMDEMISHARAVWRKNKSCFLIGDMPLGSYQESDEVAVRNAIRFMKEGGCDAVKIEGTMLNRIRAIREAGVVVMGHVGLTPHTRALLGGYTVQGKTKEAAERLLEEALSVQEAGCNFLLLEAVPKEPAERVAKALHIPVYGVGAGPLVDGQLVIFNDLMGLFPDFKSKFVKQYVNGSQLMVDGLKEYAKEVREGLFPFAENCYEMKEEELEKLLSDPRWKYTQK